MLPIKLASGNQEEPMSVEETSNEQAAIPEKVCSHTQGFAFPPYNVARLNMPNVRQSNAVSGDVLEREISLEDIKILALR